MIGLGAGFDLVAVLALHFQRVGWNRHNQASVADPLQADQATGKALYLCGFAMHDEDLKARIVIEMCVTGRDHQCVIGMLKFRQFLCDTMSMMIVDESDRADYRGIGI